MSPTPIDRSPDLRRLRDEGYEVGLTPSGNHLFVSHVPYVQSAGTVAYGLLICPLDLNGDVAAAPADHVMYFAGEYPCHQDGREIAEIRHGTGPHNLDGTVAQYSFSAKPPTPFANFHEKMVSYVRILAGPADAIDAAATARTFRAVPNTDESMPFAYADTATSRAGISEPVSKLVGQRVAIIGLGGTGSYVLDLVAKTPVREIHLYDSDAFSQHNAFRFPGAADIALWAPDAPPVLKVDHLARHYGQLHLGIHPHAVDIDRSNVDDLRVMDAIFLCIDRGEAKRVIIDTAIDAGVPVIDTGIGLLLESGRVIGSVRVSTVTPSRHDHVDRRISFGDEGADDLYAANIQIAEMNALNASLAVVKWKKLLGFYDDVEREQHCNYLVYSNRLSNDEYL